MSRCAAGQSPGRGSDRGMVFQDYALFPWMTVRQKIALRAAPASPARRAEIDAIATNYMRLVGLERFADRYRAQLSGGMKQRVAIARVLANDADILRWTSRSAPSMRSRASNCSASSCRFRAHRRDLHLRYPFGRGGGAARGPGGGDERRAGPCRQRCRGRPSAPSRRVVAGIQRRPSRSRAPTDEQPRISAHGRTARDALI